MDAETVSKHFAQYAEIYLKSRPNFTGHMGFDNKGNRLWFMAAREPGEVIITVIVVEEKLRNHGITTRLLKSFIDNPDVTRVIICGVGSSSMEAALRKNYHAYPFVCHGGDFIWQREGKYCQCHQFDKEGKMLTSP